MSLWSISGVEHNMKLRHIQKKSGKGEGVRNVICQSVARLACPNFKFLFSLWIFFSFSFERDELDTCDRLSRRPDNLLQRLAEFSIAEALEPSCVEGGTSETTAITADLLTEDRHTKLALQSDEKGRGLCQMANTD